MITKNNIINFLIILFISSISLFGNPFKKIAELKATDLDMKYQVAFFSTDVEWACKQMTILSKQWDDGGIGLEFVPPLNKKPPFSPKSVQWTTNSKKFIGVIKEIANKFHLVWEYKGNQIRYRYKTKINQK